jgi:NAD-dependent DNA ligase
MAWERTEFGGYSDTTQQMPWKDIIQWQVDMFFYSCYLYYVLDDPKLSDESFDRIVDILEANFDDLPERITYVCGPKQIKANAHLFAHDLTEQEINSAVEWKNA